MNKKYNLILSLYIVIVFKIFRYKMKHNSQEFINVVIPLIKEKLDQDMTVQQISKLLNISRNTVYKVRNDIPNKKRGVKNGVPMPKIINQIKNSVSMMRKYNKKVTAANIKSSIQTNYSKRRIQQILKECPTFKYGNIKRKIILDSNQRENRLKIIKSWFVEGVNFKSVIFTDEARFSLQGPDNFQTWQLHDNKNEEFRNMQPFKGGSIMVFGAIGYDGTFLLRKVDGILNGQKYLNMLKDDIIPELNGIFQTNYIYQQDNARPHTCKKVKEFFEQENIPLLQWPSHSPDISIIENIWKTLKDLTYDSQGFKNKEDLWIKIQVAKEKIELEKKDMIKNLYDTYVSRILSIIENKGDSK